MNRSIRRAVALAFLAAMPWATAIEAEQPPPVLKMPGAADRSVAPASLSGRGRMDVRVEETGGSVVVYHGLPLLEVLERAGLDSKTMAGERKSAAAVVIAAARDGYTVAFSVGELRMHRGDPRVFLVGETAEGPLPESEGPVRLIVYGDRARSAYALASIEMRHVAPNAAAPKN